MITGENGTGKELVARTIHNLSHRADQPLIVVNCAAIPEELIESELFGHEKGAFSGATAKKRGKFELADTGTIFLDEIGDMNVKTQGKILRALEEQKFQRVGGSRTLSVDVRVIAASNKNLEREIANGNFREDLYYRLNVIPIKVLALRERSEDIPFLIDSFLEESARQTRSSRKGMTPAALELLRAYPWPGNVRELKNLIERLAIMVEKEVIDASDLPAPYNPEVRPDAETVDEAFFESDSLKDARKKFEKEFIQRKLRQNDNNITRTAQKMGVQRSYLHRKLKQLS